MKQAKELCETCKYCDDFTCRRYPPVLAMYASGPVFLQPQVEPDDTCGEWVEREDDAEPDDPNVDGFSKKKYTAVFEKFNHDIEFSKDSPQFVRSMGLLDWYLLESSLPPDEYAFVNAKFRGFVCYHKAKDGINVVKYSSEPDSPV